jgi:hypothetical protein
VCYKGRRARCFEQLHRITIYALRVDVDIFYMEQQAPGINEILLQRFVIPSERSYSFAWADRESACTNDSHWPWAMGPLAHPQNEWHNYQVPGTMDEEFQQAGMDLCVDLALLTPCWGAEQCYHQTACNVMSPYPLPMNSDNLQMRTESRYCHFLMFSALQSCTHSGGSGAAGEDMPYRAFVVVGSEEQRKSAKHIIALAVDLYQNLFTGKFGALLKCSLPLRSWP